MPLSLRKLKKLDGYFGRLFVDEDDANKWLERMRMKMGSGFVFDKRKQNEGGTTFILAFMHKE